MTATTAVTPVAGLEHANPASLLVDLNIRSAAELDDTFLQSIGQLGVLVPIVAVRTVDGELRVRYGHRRAIAAVECGLDQVPVLVVGDVDEADRIERQWAENEHRAGLTTSDKVAAVEQLALLGLSAGDIAARTRADILHVDQALATSKSKLARKSAARYDLTLDQAAAIAEFDDDAEVVKKLVVSAKDDPGRFPHVLQRARDDRAEAEQIAVLGAELEEAGVPVVDASTISNWDGKVKGRALDHLADSNGKAFRAAAHKKCPGHAALIEARWNIAAREPKAVYVCTDWRANGHKDRYGSGSSSSGAAATPAEKEKASKERREVLANNKAWRSAETVRRAWLKTFLTAKTPPAGTASFVAFELAMTPTTYQVDLRDSKSVGLTVNTLGADAGGKGNSGSVAALVATATEQRAQVITLGLLLCALEASTSTDTWRGPSEPHKRYFAFLADHGYELADVEHLAAGAKRKRAVRRDL